VVEAEFVASTPTFVSKDWENKMSQNIWVPCRSKPGSPRVQFRSITTWDKLLGKAIKLQYLLLRKQRSVLGDLCTYCCDPQVGCVHSGVGKKWPSCLEPPGKLRSAHIYTRAGLPSIPTAGREIRAPNMMAHSCWQTNGGGGGGGQRFNRNSARYP
jgi:hypothetical protein